MKTLTITSRHNPLLQEVRRAVADGKPTPEGFIVAEGPHLLEEAIRGWWQLEQILATAEARKRFANLLGMADAEVVEVSETALASAAGTEHGQGVISLLRPKLFAWSDLLPQTGALVLVLDGVQDPGNAGTLVRSAEAFGVSGVALTRSSVRVPNAKFLRATAGSIFRLPYLEEVRSNELLSRFEERGITLWALAAQGATSILEANLRHACGLAVGSEGRGVSPELQRGARALSVPSGTVESLNAAVAGSIALFEASRQRER